MAGQKFDMWVVGRSGKSSPGLEPTYRKTSTRLRALRWSKLKQSKGHVRFWKIIQSFDRLQETSKCKETLEVTEARQYRQRGLLHISDEAYLFFMKLEQRRVDLLNVNVMRKERENMVQAAICRLTRDEELKESWMRCFPSEDIDRSEVCNICPISTMGYKILVNFGAKLVLIHNQNLYITQLRSILVSFARH